MARRLDELHSSSAFNSLPETSQQAIYSALMGIDYSTYARLYGSGAISQSLYSSLPTRYGIQVSQSGINPSINLSNLHTVSAVPVRPGSTLESMWAQAPMQRGYITPSNILSQFIEHGGAYSPNGLGSLAPGSVPSYTPLTQQQVDNINYINNWIVNNPPPSRGENWLTFHAEISNPNSQLVTSFNNLRTQGFFNAGVPASNILRNFENFATAYVTDASVETAVRPITYER